MHGPARASRFLEQTMLANVIIHALAIVTGALLMAPGLPGGPASDVADRAAYVAAHPWLWRLGWLPWHLAAVIDILTGISLVSTRWVPRLPAWLTLLATLCAVVPEQTGEVTWVSQGVRLASEAVQSGDYSAYAALEQWAFHLVVVVGASIYLAMALGWTWCFAAAGVWTRGLTWLSVFTWGCLAVGSIGLLLPGGWQPSPLLAGAANGAGFILLVIWLILVTEQILRRSRPEEPHGRLAPWRSPRSGFLGWISDILANSRFPRALGEWLPAPEFRSDITNVIYVNHLVPAERLEALAPAGLELQRVGPDGKLALLSSLTYQHGHFGPAMLGPLRRLLPSPLQSNWRVYVRDPLTGKQGVYFFTTAINSTLHALAARHLSEGVAMHVPDRAELHVEPSGEVHLLLEPGKGSGPDLRAELRPGPRQLPAAYAAVWEDYDAFLRYAVLQDRAMSVQPWYDQRTRQEIVLGISVQECESLCGEVESRTVRAIAREGEMVCFRVARVEFRLVAEVRDSGG